MNQPILISHFSILYIQYIVKIATKAKRESDSSTVGEMLPFSWPFIELGSILNELSSEWQRATVLFLPAVANLGEGLVCQVFKFSKTQAVQDLIDSSLGCHLKGKQE